MKNKSNDGWITFGAGIAVAALVVGISYLFASWTDSNLDYWLTNFKGHAVHVPLWLAWLLSVALNGIAFIANLIAEIAKYL